MPTSHSTFIGGSTPPRTFKTSKAAKVAAKRDTARETGVPVRDWTVSERDGRYIVTVAVEATRATARAHVAKPLAGFYIRPLAPKKARTAKKPAAASTPKREPNIHSAPGTKLYPLRPNTMLHRMATALVGGATLDELRKVCVGGDGTPWRDSSIKTTMSWHLGRKGYGVRTIQSAGKPARYVLLFPAGAGNKLLVTAPPAKKD